MRREGGAFRRACLRACPCLESKLSIPFPALAARFASCAPSHSSCTESTSESGLTIVHTGPSGGERPVSDVGDAALSSNGPAFAHKHSSSSCGISGQRGFTAGFWRSIGNQSTLGQQCGRSFSAQALPAKEADGPQPLGFVKGGYSVEQFPPEKVRNFSIIAHVDHGKSTLADRLLEMTGAIPRGGRAQYLDKLQVERERGITVKAQTVSLVYNHRGEDYLVNLVDTPGHVDFSYEVSRSLAACQGALLLVDAAQGIQAQTVANFYLAFDLELSIVPVLNKIDLPAADPEKVAEQVQQVFDIPADACLLTSAKTGRGLDAILPAIIEQIPPPDGSPDKPLKLLLFDAYHDDYRGVICLVEVIDGILHKGDRVTACSSGESYDILEVGLLTPEPAATQQLRTGQVGYVITGMKSTRSARLGDTWHLQKQRVEPLPGFKPIKSMVFAGLYPVSSADFDALASAVERLTLNDASVAVKRENSAALGAGFRCGYLGLLHMEVFHQRLDQEYGANIITTTPTVPYTLQHPDGSSEEIQNPSQYPLGKKLAGIYEPTVAATIITPTEHVGSIMQLAQDRRGDLTEHTLLRPERTLLRYTPALAELGGNFYDALKSITSGYASFDYGGCGAAQSRYTLPLAELGGNFYDALKSITSGYASFDYEAGEQRKADLVRLDLLLNGEAVDALARVVHREKAQRVGAAMCAAMKDKLSRQMFEVVIQAAANGKIVARETLKAFRKNVLAKCYGGDVSRKRKLLEKQKEGKARMRRVGQVDLPQDVFHSLMRT